MHEGRLPRARGAHDGGEATGFEVDADVVEGVDSRVRPAEALAQALRPKDDAGVVGGLTGWDLTGGCGRTTALIGGVRHTGPLPQIWERLRLHYTLAQSTTPWGGAAPPPTSADEKSGGLAPA